MKHTVARLVLVAAVGAVVIVPGAASASVRARAAASKTEARVPSEVTVAFAASMGTLNPILGDGLQTINAEGLIGEGLYEFGYGTTSKPDPGLAESSSVSANKLTWTFKLRPNLKFSNGSPLAASDVAATLNHDITTKANVYSDLTAPMKAASAPNTTTVVLSLKAPYPDLKTVLAEAGFLILPASAWAQPTSSSYWDHPVSAGPYEMKSWDGGNTAVMVENPYYWGPKPAIHTVKFTTIADSNTAESELKTGEIDMAGDLPMSTEPELASERGVTWKLVEAYGLYGFALNDNEAPFTNVKVRKAVNDAITRQILNKELWRGDAKPISGFWPSTMTGYNPKLSTKQNLSAARSLLKGTPCAKGCNVTMTYNPANGPWAELGSEIAASELGAIGIHVSITEVGTTKWDDTVLSAKNYQIALTYIYTSANYPNGLLEYDALSSSYFKAFYSNWSNPKIAGLVTKADESTGASEVSALHAITKLFLATQPFVTVATWNTMWAQRVPDKYIEVEPTDQVEVASG